MLFAVVRRLLGVLAVFAVVFAPATSDVGFGNAQAEANGADLSGAVLAPTFTSSELILGRQHENVADEEQNEIAGYSPGEPDPPRESMDRSAPLVAETLGATDNSAKAWPSRAPPAS